MKSFDATALLEILQQRFENNPQRHSGLAWMTVAKRIAKHPSAMRSLHSMEQSGGEPDVVEFSPDADAITFVDCAPESPSGRRSLCYDHAALKSRKANPPENSADRMASSMGIALLSEDQYRHLQSIGEFDRKSSSWLNTPPDVRALGGAIFGERRFGRVFICANGAESYFRDRGFRGVLKV